MKQVKYILFFTLAFSAANLRGQGALFLKAKSYDDAVLLHFFPLKPSDWAQNPDAAYRIERVETDAAGQNEIPGTRVVLAAALRPQNPAWFEAHKADEQGLMQAVGALMYDTLFQFKDKSLIDPDSMRWNYVVFEALNRPLVGLATGLSLPDTTAQAGKTYRYTASNNRLPNLQNSVTIPHSSGTEVQAPEGLVIKFHFPESRSLSDMIPRLEKPVLPQVFALAKSYQDSIMVRWAPSSAQFWYRSNKKGYWLLRSEEIRGKLTPADTIGLLKPWPRERVLKWAEQNGGDSLAMLAASILYNEQPALPVPLSEQAQIFETKYGFALFAAEGSRLAAQILGLGYVDKKVKPGAVYEYRVVAADAPSAFSQGETRITNQKSAMPKVASFSAVQGDQLIELTWEIPANRRVFSAYELQRAEIGGDNWQKLHHEPLTFIENEDAPRSVYNFRDSVRENYHKYRYRIRGLDSFGDWSLWEELSSEALDLTPPPTPFINLANYNDSTNTALIRWEMSDIPDDFAEFILLLGADVEGEYQPLARLNREAREYRWKPDTLLSGNRSYFFRVTAADVHKNQSRSVERFMTVPDLIAPPPPARLAGYIEKDGTVSIVWEPSKAADLIGYWVYWANNPTDEFSILNKKRLTDNVFQWKIEDKSLTPYLYVAVAAEDSHFNRGKASEPLRLKRPDKIPPVTPQLLSVVQDGRAVLVKWNPSPSEDVQKHLVLRRASGKNPGPWQIIDSLERHILSYSDTSAGMGERMSYAVMARDDSGNWSDTSNVMSTAVRFVPGMAAVSLKLSKPAERPGTVRLDWAYTPPPLAFLPKSRHEFLIYRSTGNENPQLLKTLDPAHTWYEDQNLSSGVVYNYAVQVYFPQTGDQGQKSPVKSVLLNTGSAETAGNLAEKNRKIAVRGKDLTIPDGSESPTSADNTDFGAVGTGAKKSHGFFIQNNGDKDLRLPREALTLESGDPTVWKLFQPENNVVRGFGNAEKFFIEFNPQKEKEYRAVVRIGTDPAYRFTVRGEGSGNAELEVEGKGVSITNNDMKPGPDDDTDFGNIRTGGNLTHTFLIRNIGSAPLHCTGAPQISGDESFAVRDFNMPEGGVIPPGGNIELNIEFSPLETSVHDAEIAVFSDDPDETVFKFGITGIGLGPEINLSGENGGPILDGSLQPELYNDTDFGKVGLNIAHSRKFIIRNTGGTALNLTGRPVIAVSGENKSEFRVAKEVPDHVKPGNGEEHFEIIFQPLSAGLKKALISIENNDANESKFDFVIQGTGAAPPEIFIYGIDNEPVISETDSASLKKGTDFGLLNAGASALCRLRLGNGGESDLHIEKIELEGVDAGSFSIETRPDRIVGKESSLVIQFKPAGAGEKRAVLVIRSDDPEKPVYRINLKGKSR